MGGTFGPVQASDHVNCCLLVPPFFPPLFPSPSLFSSPFWMPLLLLLKWLLERCLICSVRCDFAVGCNYGSLGFIYDINWSCGWVNMWIFKVKKNDSCCRGEKKCSNLSKKVIHKNNRDSTLPALKPLINNQVLKFSPNIKAKASLNGLTHNSGPVQRYVSSVGFSF